MGNLLLFQALFIIGGGAVIAALSIFFVVLIFKIADYITEFLYGLF